jgi:hypothetical protein
MEHHSHASVLPALLASARASLRFIREHPAPLPSAGSPAHDAFDPYVARRLSSSIPLRVVELPGAQEGTWRWVEGMLEGWEEVGRLCGAGGLRVWEVKGLVLWLWVGIDSDIVFS